MVLPDPTHVLIPVKAFRSAKGRLTPALTLAERVRLARHMATGVVQATRGLPTWVVCDDDEVAAWAQSRGAGVSWHPRSGLNGAVHDATVERFAAGASRVVVIHSDLPLVSSIAVFTAVTDEILLAPDRHGSGTNVVSTPTPDFRFAFGPGSFDRHLAEAQRLAIPLRIVDDPSFGWDVDEPADLSVFDIRAAPRS